MVYTALIAAFDTMQMEEAFNVASAFVLLLFLFQSVLCFTMLEYLQNAFFAVALLYASIKSEVLIFLEPLPVV